MTGEASARGGGDAGAAPVLLLTAWRLGRMRSMPRAFLAVRALERRGRTQPGCVRVHRWISRRSLLLTSWWRTRADAEAWLASAPFRETDARLRAIPGAVADVELRDGGGAR